MSTGLEDVFSNTSLFGNLRKEMNRMLSERKNVAMEKNKGRREGRRKIKRMRKMEEINKCQIKNKWYDNTNNNKSW